MVDLGWLLPLAAASSTVIRSASQFTILTGFTSNVKYRQAGEIFERHDR
jgi:hypothetical protein